MGFKRIVIDYTVYPSNYNSDHDNFYTYRGARRARAKARVLGEGARVIRNFNETNKQHTWLGDWWNCDQYWLWNGDRFLKLPEDFERHDLSEEGRG